jgi:hypothetical protein
MGRFFLFVACDMIFSLCIISCEKYGYLPVVDLVLSEVYTKVVVSNYSLFYLTRMLIIQTLKLFLH